MDSISRAVRQLATAAALTLAASSCHSGAAQPAESVASGRAPAELELCPSESPAAGSCPNACGDLQTVAGWNASSATTGATVAVVEVAEEQVLFGAAGATVFRGGMPVSNDSSIAQWSGAASLPAADGNGTWAVGIALDGQLWRVTGMGQLDAISDRFGLASDKVLSAAAAGGRAAGFALESGLAVSDGAALRRYDAHPERLAGAGGALAWVEGDEVCRLEIATGALTRWHLSGALAVTIAQNGRLAVATAHELWVGPPSGDLARAYRTTAALGALAASENRFWFLQDGELGSLDGDAVAHTAAPVADARASLAPAVGGGVWTVSSAAPQKWSHGVDELAVWQKSVQPVFARVCATCHQAGGAASPLASLQAWKDNKAAIRARVLEGSGGGPMPPTTAPQPAQDELDQLRCWLGAQ